MTRGAAVNCAASVAGRIARHMRRDLHLATCADEATGVVVLVSIHCDADVWSANVGQHGCRDIPFGITISGAGAHIDHQSVTVVGQHMPQVTPLCRRNTAFAVQLALGISDGSMGGVSALLSMPVVRRPVVVAAIFAPYAFILDQCAVDAEVLARQQPFAGRHLHGGIE